MYDYRQALIPQPQKITDGGKSVCLGSVDTPAYALSFGCCDSPVFASAEQKLRCALPTRNAGENAFPITLTVDAAKVAHKEGYTIEITEAAATLTGADAAGAFYAAVTFAKLLYTDGGNLYLPVTVIEDYPSFPFRSLFLEDRYGSEFMTLEDYKEAIDYFADMKYNSLTIGVYGCWHVQYDNRFAEYLYLPNSKHPDLKTPMSIKYYSAEKQEYILRDNVLPTMFEQDFFGEVVRYAASKNITVRPLFNSLGHNTLIPRVYPELSAQDEEGNLMGRGMCPSNPKTYEVLFDIYDEIVDKYLLPNGIDSFHIGMDEVRVSDTCHCEKCRQQDISQLPLEHVIKLAKHLKEKGIKHIHMYYDTVFNFYRNIPSNYMAADAAVLTQAEVDARVNAAADRFRQEGIYDNMVLDWWSYTRDEKLFYGRELNNSFRSVIKPMTGYYHWISPNENNDSIYGCAKRAVKYGYEGIESYSSLEYCFDRPYQYQAEVSWNASTIDDQAGFYKRYAYALSPEAPEKVEKAMAILGDLAENDRKPNRISKLDYYWTSYKRGKRSYPRCYMEELLENIEADKEGYLTYFENTRTQAAEALRLLESAPIANEQLRKTHIASCKHFLYYAGVYQRLYGILSGATPREKIAPELKRIVSNLDNLILIAEQTRREYTLYHYARDISILREMCLAALAALEQGGEFSFPAIERASTELLNALR